MPYCIVVVSSQSAACPIVPFFARTILLQSGWIWAIPGQFGVGLECPDFAFQNLGDYLYFSEAAKNPAGPCLLQPGGWFLQWLGLPNHCCAGFKRFSHFCYIFWHLMSLTTTDALNNGTRLFVYSARTPFFRSMMVVPVSWLCPVFLSLLDSGD